MKEDDLVNFFKLAKILQNSGGELTEEAILKFIVSNLKPEQQKNAQPIIKYIEFENAAKKFKSQISVQSNQDNLWKKDMISELKDSFSNKQKFKLDLLMKCIEINEIIKKF